MLLTITPIGSSPTDVAAAASAYVDYLCGSGSTALADGTYDIASYYSSGPGFDLVDGPGWWSGGGADLLDLGASPVEAEVFEALLHGRHHQTGERLISAQGSAGRVHLKAGKPTRLLAGQPVWSKSDAEVASGGQIPPGVVANHQLIADENGVDFLGVAGMEALLRAAGRIAPAVTLADVASGEGLVKASDVASAIDVTRRHLNQLCADISSGAVEDEWELAPTKVGRTWMVSRLGALAWVEHREPAAVRVGYDATLTTEKSLSVLALCVPDATAEAVDALSEANRVAMGWLQMHASTGRSRGESVSSYGHAVASFMHGTSRNDDPFLHVHNVVLNAITDEHGNGRALDATGLYAQAPAAAALATAAMRRRLTERLGVDWRLSGRDTWEVAGIDDTVLEGFSTRSAEIESALQELFDSEERVLGEPGASERDVVAKGSRRAKSGRSAAELAGEWDNRATELGFTSRTRSKVLGRRQLEQGDLGEQDRKKLWRWLSSPEGVCSDSASARLGDVFWAIANWAPEDRRGNKRLAVLDADQIVVEAERWLSSQRVVKLDPTLAVSRNGHSIGASVEPTWTTTAMLELQTLIGNAWASAHDGTGATATSTQIRVAIAAADVELSDEQQDLVRSWVGSGHKLQAAIGRPGTGKTTTMATAADAWDKAGFNVHGAAVKGEAARLLGDEARIASDTVASYLAVWKRGGNRLDNKSVLVVDEASTLSDWDLAGLIAMCQEASATLRLIGDPAQHSSVDAGGSWASLLNRFATHTPELTYQRRLRNPIEAEAAELVRSHEFGAALEKLRQAGSVETFDSWSDACVPLMRRWWAARHNGAPHPLVERTNERREVLNSLAQAMRHDAGEIGKPLAVGSKQFAVGDEVVAKEPHNDLPGDAGRLRNGATGTVTSFTLHHVVIDFDSLGEVKVPKAWCGRPKGIDLAYAQTSYSVQGATNNASTSVIGRGVSASELLVNITRGRKENVVFAVGDGDDEFSAEVPRDIAAALANSVRTGAAGRVDDMDPLAVAVHGSSLAASRLADLDPKLFEGLSDEEADVLGRISASRREALAMRTQLAKLPSAVTDLLGAKPSVPFKAHRWERTATEILTYWDTHRPKPDRGAHLVDRVLGAPGKTAQAQAARAKVADTINNYVESQRSVEAGL